METYYDILQVKPDASLMQIKKSFLSLVSMYHPDIYRGDKTFAQMLTSKLTEAYTVLKNDESRRLYDESLKINHTMSGVRFMRKDTSSKVNKKPFIHPREERVKKENLEQSEVRKLLRNNKSKNKSKKKFIKSKLFYILLLVFGAEVVLLLFLIRN